MINAITTTRSIQSAISQPLQPLAPKTPAPASTVKPIAAIPPVGQSNAPVRQAVLPVPTPQPVVLPVAKSVLPVSQPVTPVTQVTPVPSAPPTTPGPVGKPPAPVAKPVALPPPPTAPQTPKQTILEVGAGKQFKTINDAIRAADKMGGNADIKVAAGIYTNDGGYLWDGINNVTIEGVGGMAKIVDPTFYAGGKAAIVTGGQNITLKNLDISGVKVPDGNGAALRYDQGTLLLDHVHFHDNENGILAAGDANGSITIQKSEFDHNGTDSGRTHNIYIGDIRKFTLTDSYIHDANVGHEVKSRAENNTITNNRILDNSATSSYSIDLPNGGNATITGNVIQQGAKGQNRTINAYGEEGKLHAGNAVTFANNQVINDNPSGAGPLWNNNGAMIKGSGNSVWNLTDLGKGVDPSGVTHLKTRPDPLKVALVATAYNATTALVAPSVPASRTPPTANGATSAFLPHTT